MTATTLPAMLQERARSTGDDDAMCFESEGKWLAITYAALDRSVQDVAAGLLALDLQPGEKVGIVSYNRPEWSIADLAIQRSGGVTVPVYPTSTPAQVAYIARHAGLRIIFVGGRSELATVAAALPEAPEVRHVVVSDDREAWDPETATAVAETEAQGRCAVSDFASLVKLGQQSDRSAAVAARQESLDSHDVATIVYTSGTTGDPKGVMLSHANFMHQMRAVDERFDVGPADRSLCFLPLSHVFERSWSYYIFSRGATN